MSARHRLEAYGALWRRYTTIFGFYWKQRQGLSGKILNESEAEFLPSALALQNKPVSPAARILSRVLVSIVVVLIAWACLGKMDIVVHATGKIIPSGYTKTIASIDVASVRALYVDEGQKVKAGDVLMELDATASDAERDKASGDGGTALLQAARAQALINAIDTGKPPQLAPVNGVSQDKWHTAKLHLDGQFRDYTAKLKRIDGDIARYTEALPLAAQRAQDYKALLLDRDVSRHAWIEKEQARIEISGQLADARNQRRALTEEMRRTAYDQMTEGRKLADAYQQDVLRSDARSRLLKITSPVDGTVQQLDVHTIGGVVAAAKPLMQIVPSDSKVVVEAFLENKDVLGEARAAYFPTLTSSVSRIGTSTSFPESGNASIAANTSFMLDTTHPTVAITSTASLLQAGETTTITFTFSEDPGSTFVAAGIAVTGGEIGETSGTGLTRIAIFTPATDSIDTATVSVANGKFADAAGNFNSDGGDANNIVSMAVDTTSPALLTSSNLSSGFPQYADHGVFPGL